MITQHKETKRLVIDVDNWWRGQGALSSRLKRPSDGKMCCIGFLGAACEVNPEHLNNCATVAMLPTAEQARFPVQVLSTKVAFDRLLDNPLSSFEPDVTPWLVRAYTTNDWVGYTEERRREMLKEHFNIVGIELVFTDEKGSSNA